MSNIPDLPNQKDYKDLTPFDLVLIQKFPFIEEDFDSINLYGILSEIKEHLNNVIKNEQIVTENQQNVYNSFKGLYDFVNDYFDNLDVQDEINNKLDEMVESGVLENILMNYANVIKVYNTTVEMLNDNKLKNNQKVKTLGYYEINDGGGAEFIISNVNNLFSINTSNNLFANIIINNKINVKQMGAKGDGVNSDSTSIQNCIDIINNSINSNTIFNKQCVIEIPTGKYIIDNTIILPIYVKLKPLGNVLFLSNVSNGSCLHITSGNREIMRGNGLICYYDQSYVQGGIIDGSCGGITIQRNIPENPYYDVNNNNNSIGLEIGDIEYNENFIRTSRFLINHLSIHQFTVGLKLNTNNLYLCKFDNMFIQRNRYNVIYGDKNNPPHNSGENITFNNCIFALAYTSFIINSTVEMNFNNCSFDFNGCVFDVESYAGSKINILGGHIEGVGITNEQILTNINNTIGFGCICYNNIDDIYARSRFNIFGTCEYNVSNGNAFINKFQSTKNMENRCHLAVGIYATEFNKHANDNSLFNCFLTNDKDTEIIHYDIQKQGGSPSFLKSPYTDFVGRLENIPDNRSSNTALETNDNYKINVSGGVDINPDKLVSIKMNTIDKIFNKSIDVEFANSSIIQLERILNSPSKNKIGFVAYFKPVNVTGVSDIFNKMSVAYNVRSKNNNGINTNAERLINSDNIVYDETTGWYRTLLFINDISTGSDFVKINFTIHFKNENNIDIPCNGSMRFGGLICEYYD